MDSELELDEEIKKLHILAASPELYPVFIRMNSTESLIKLLLHDNPGNCKKTKHRLEGGKVGRLFHERKTKGV